MISTSQMKETCEFLSQGDNFGIAIRENIHDICNGTINMDRLAARLQSWDILNPMQVQGILCQGSNFYQLKLLYDTLVIGNADPEKVLKALEKSQNSNVIYSLMSKTEVLKVPEPVPDNETTPNYPGQRQAPVSPPVSVFDNEFIRESVNSIEYGGFGSVVSAKLKNKDKIYALKVLVLTDLNQQVIEREVKLLEDLKDGKDPRSKFIVRIKRHWRELYDETVVKDVNEFLGKYPPLRLGQATMMKLKGLVFIQMELCDPGSLDAWVELNNIEGKEQENLQQYRRKWFRQVVEGVSFLHSRQPPIWHRDLKLSNILLAKEEDPVEVKRGNRIIAKIADFGQSRYCPPQGVAATKTIGTYAYASPEVVDRARYSEKTDIYSLGVVLVSLLMPMKDKDKQTLDNYYHFLCGDKDIRHVVPHEFSTAFPEEFKMAELMLKKDPSERPSASELLEWCKTHQFI